MLLIEWVSEYVCLFLCLLNFFVLVSIRLSVCLSVCVSVRLLSVCLSIHSYARLPTHLSVRPSVCLSDWQGYDMWFEVLNSAIFTDHAVWTHHIFPFFLRSLKRLSEAEAMLKKAIR